MYTSLYVLDYTAELIELAYDLGAATRKYAVPALAAIYVAAIMVVGYAQQLRSPMRSEMIHDLLQEWEKIITMDPEGDTSESLEFLWYLESLSTQELRREWRAIK